VLSKELVNLFFHETVKALQETVQAHGFSAGSIPEEYIIAQYSVNLIEHLKEFFFKFAVINFLFNEIYEKKLLVAGDPRLVDIVLDYDSDARFVFDLSIFPAIVLNDWKYFLFKAPNRKNYKDLDRQVQTFIDEEQKLLEQHKNSEEISLNDWVRFELSVVDCNNVPLDERGAQAFWLKLGDEEVESPLRALFIGKKTDDQFVVKNKGLQSYFSDQTCGFYNFHITITDIVPHNYFCFDQFKHHFRIKTNKDMHKKLIEVFSYRNDISQRLTMVEDALKLLLSKHRFLAPQHLVLRQQKIILSAIQKNPDYNVYRKQKEFQTWVTQLAEKQVKESLLIDQLAYNENLAVSTDDIMNYLNCDKRNRMKEFIYFSLPETKRDGQEMPLPEQELKRLCLREKALNHAIYYLTKK
jgi:FKBP-type peptidyl-prolyl cis-trans isomerase (trigger factor)